MKKIWSGGLSDSEGPDLSPLMTEEDNEVDAYLVKYEVTGLIAYHLELSKSRIIDLNETREILSSLLSLLEDNLQMSPEYEDVHSMVESKVKALTDAGKDLRIFLSRNDQSHYDIRSFYIDRLLEIAKHLLSISLTIKKRFSGVGGFMAGYTHYRQAMPLSFETYFDYISSIFIDLAGDSVDLSGKFARFLPLGYGSGYGSELPIDRSSLASDLGFGKMFSNPMHGAFHRGIDDTEVAFLETRIMIGISRLAQDLITLSSEEFGIVKLPSGYTTGSSLMPNKRNPDFLEMLQGYASEALGTLVTSTSILMNKGSGYHREFQLSKDKVMKYTIRLVRILDAIEGMIPGIEIDKQMAAEVLQNTTYATNEVYRLFSGGMKWKDAYAEVGRKLRLGLPVEATPPRSFVSTTVEEIEKLTSSVEDLIEQRNDLAESIIRRAREMYPGSSSD